LAAVAAVLATVLLAALELTSTSTLEVVLLVALSVALSLPDCRFRHQEEPVGLSGAMVMIFHK
jgi:hypothetical protein